MKFLKIFTFLVISSTLFQLVANEEIETVSSPDYHMVTVSIANGEVLFDSDDDFLEATKVGFFRIKAPSDLNLEAGRIFAKTFTSNSRYNQFGVLDVVNGYLLSGIAQTVRFALERAHWNKCYVNLQEVEGSPIFSPEIQELGYKINEIGILVLRSILKQYELPKNLWFEATAGASHGEGSLFKIQLL